MAKKAKRKSSRRWFGRKRSHKKDRRIPLLVTVPVAWRAIVQPIFGGSNGIPEGQGALYHMQQGNLDGAVKAGGRVLVGNFTGFDILTGQWNMTEPMTTYGMLLAGWLGGKIATKIGANKALERIPLIGKYIKL